LTILMMATLIISITWKKPSPNHDPPDSNTQHDRAKIDFVLCCCRAVSVLVCLLLSSPVLFLFVLSLFIYFLSILSTSRVRVGSSSVLWENIC
jgi:hypothetical protein